jgi:hypothetical protein
MVFLAWELCDIVFIFLEKKFQTFDIHIGGNKFPKDFSLRNNFLGKGNYKKV